MPNCHWKENSVTIWSLMSRFCLDEDRGMYINTTSVNLMAWCGHVPNAGSSSIKIVCIHSVKRGQKLKRRHLKTPIWKESSPKTSGIWPGPIIHYSWNLRWEISRQLNISWSDTTGTVTFDYDRAVYRAVKIDVRFDEIILCNVIWACYRNYTNLSVHHLVFCSMRCKCLRKRRPNMQARQLF